MTRTAGAERARALRAAAAWLLCGLLLAGCAARPAKTGGAPVATTVVPETEAKPAAAPAVPPVAAPAQPIAEPAPETVADAGTRSGRDVYRQFHDGLADKQCNAVAGNRYRGQFRHAPGQLAKAGDDLLPLFGYVVDSLRDAGLPTEFALIPFVESGYEPGARSKRGPAGLWQLVAVTARDRGVAIRNGYDGRLSPAESTRAAVTYLKHLYPEFGGDWRLTTMAYNAGEFRIKGAMRRAGLDPRNAEPRALRGLSPVTYAYVEKLHALACLFDRADDGEDWLQALDRPVPRLVAMPLPAGASSLDGWASAEGYDPALLRRLNPALAKGIARGGNRTPWVLAPARAGVAVSAGIAANDATPIDGGPSPSAGDGAGAAAPQPAAPAHSHVVKRGDSLWSIARKYGISAQRLRELNRLDAGSVLKPGRVLRLD